MVIVIFHCPLFIVHCLLVILHSSFFFVYRSFLIYNSSLVIGHCSLFIVHDSNGYIIPVTNTSFFFFYKLYIYRSVRSRFDCEICDAKCNSQQMYDLHLAGKRHKKKLTCLPTKVQVTEKNRYNLISFLHS